VLLHAVFYGLRATTLGPSGARADELRFRGSILPSMHEVAVRVTP